MQQSWKSFFSCHRNQVDLGDVDLGGVLDEGDVLGPVASRFVTLAAAHVAASDAQGNHGNDDLRDFKRPNVSAVRRPASPHFKKKIVGSNPGQGVRRHEFRHRRSLHNSNSESDFFCNFEASVNMYLHRVIHIKFAKGIHIWGRCYDHNFLRFSPIFGEKIGVFLKKQCYDQIFAKFSFVLSKKRQFFR
jgi:hypothetical protein